ncbi:MAG TPA: glycosyltransferase family 9 protein [Candidatus Fermentibacter sp.]|nr:glycosyltransferase family 9 protein [Candidatus Fermentibacter sp.]
MTSSSRTPSERAAILRLHSLGDVVLCQPVASLFARYNSTLFITAEEYLPVAERFGAGIACAGVPRSNACKAIRREIAAFGPDRVVDLQGNLTTRLGTWPREVPRFATDRRLRREALAGGASMPPRALDFARVAGFESSPPPVLTRAALPGDGFHVALVCGGRWPLKSLPRGVVAELARLFIDLDGARVTLAGGPEDASEIAATASSVRRPGVSAYAGGGGIAGLLDVLERQHLVISPDSGPAHVSRALGVPTLVVFTSTSPALGFWPAEGSFGPSAPCSPCHRHGGLRCRTGTMECRSSILPRDVYDRAMEEAGRR